LLNPNPAHTFPFLDEKIILRWFFWKREGGEWTDLAQDKDRWQAL
jgi:hypothetical protein